MGIKYRDNTPITCPSDGKGQEFYHADKCSAKNEAFWRNFETDTHIGLWNFCIFVKIRNSFYGEYADQFAIFRSDVRGIRARTGGSHDADFVSLPARLGRLIPS